MIDDCSPGHQAPCNWPNAPWSVPASLTATATRPADAAFAAAISALREHSTPYHLADGLLGHAGYLTRLGHTEAAETSISEARDIAGRLRCQLLLDRAAGLTPAELRIGAPMVTAPGPEESATARDG